MTIAQPVSSRLPIGFWTAFLANVVWINLSEVVRYFAFVMPMMREALPGVPDAAPMSVPVFLVWGLWDMILITVVTAVAWVLLGQFGRRIQAVFTIGTGIWLGIFGILWLGLFNMNLAPWSVLAVALPLAWLEMVIAVALVAWAMGRSES